jgi:hypothetical protein
VDAGAASAFAAWYAAILSTVLAVVGGIIRWRARRARLQLRPFVVWSPQSGAGFRPRLHMEAVNMCERNLSLSQWIAEQPGGPTVAGSPYEGRIEGPGMLKPGQLHPWDIPLDSPGGAFGPDTPITVTVRLTTGEWFTTEPINLWLAPRPQ